MRQIKRLLKNTLRRVGYDLVRYAEVPVEEFDVLRYVVREQLTKDSHFYFVQIGAFDGKSNDPLRNLIVQHSLPGLLVEPQPEQFAQLKANYAGYPDLRFEQCAIGHYNGEVQLYRIRQSAPLPSWTLQLASFSRSHLIGATTHLKDAEQHIEEITVPCLTFQSLLERHGAPEVTLLQVDTEGFDYEIVKMALEAGLRPAIINYEFAHLLAATNADCKKLLMQSDYQFIDVGLDTLAVKQSG